MTCVSCWVVAWLAGMSSWVMAARVVSMARIEGRMSYSATDMRALAVASGSAMARESSTFGAVSRDPAGLARASDAVNDAADLIVYSHTLAGRGRWALPR